MQQVILLTTNKFLYTADVDTIALVETRVIQLFAGLLAFYLFCRFVVPIIGNYIKSVQIDTIKNEMESNMVKLHRELTDLNTTLKEIKDKMKTIAIFLLLSFSLAACDSDRIIVYRIRNKEDRGMPAILVKDCDPPCTGNLKCDSATGKCTGTAKEPRATQIQGHSDLIYSVNKYGSLGENEWKVRR